MTSAERVKFCEESPTLALRMKARAAAALPARLRAGRSVARVAIGETQKAVLARLGWPDEKRFELRPCRGLAGCTARRGLGWHLELQEAQAFRRLRPDRRVAALEHRGNQRTVRGVGKDSTLASVRGAFPPPGVPEAAAAARLLGQAGLRGADDANHVPLHRAREAGVEGEAGADLRRRT